MTISKEEAATIANVVSHLVGIGIIMIYGFMAMSKPRKEGEKEEE